MEKGDYIFGTRAVLEAVESGKSIDKILLRKEMGGDIAREIMEKARLYGIPVQRVPMEKLNRITMKNHQGAIGRTANCAAFDGIVIPERNSASVTPDAMKTSAGGLLYVPVCRERDMLTAVRMLKESGVKIVGATEKASVNYTQIDYTVPVAIVMGNEEHGISDEVLRACDELAAIPILGKIGSLNVSVAAGILMYEAIRQRGN